VEKLGKGQVITDAASGEARLLAKVKRVGESVDMGSSFAPEGSVCSWRGIWEMLFRLREEGVHFGGRRAEAYLFLNNRIRSDAKC
jgi:hypothetical protein